MSFLSKKIQSKQLLLASRHARHIFTAFRTLLSKSITRTSAQAVLAGAKPQHQ
jgi:hypothetical protein